MYKLLIADDESIIRRGLRKSLNWESLNIEVIGEAEDGELALEMVRDFSPDIILLDICMPFLNGLDLVKKIREKNTCCKLIIITGHAEFSYAHEAIKLKVDDFLLKPVKKSQLQQVISRVVTELDEELNEKEYTNWYTERLNENKDSIKGKIVDKILQGKLSKEEIKTELNLATININSYNQIIVIHQIETLKNNNKLCDKLNSFAVKNIIEEHLEKIISEYFIYESDTGEFVVLCYINNKIDALDITVKIEESIEIYLKSLVIVERAELLGDIEYIPKIYTSIHEKIKERLKIHPIVFNAINYINRNYFNEELNLEIISNKLNVNSTYLSKKMKKDLGVSFIEYLINVRIEAAIKLMDDPSIRLYDVAQLVGYKNQYYFSKAFKKIKGLSPKEFIKKI